MRPTSLVWVLIFLSLPSLASAQIVTTVAGVPGQAGHRDGNVAQALFHRPTWLDVDPVHGSIYVVDRVNQVVRRITGPEVTTLAVARLLPTGENEVPFDFDGGFGGGIAIEPFGAGCGGSSYDRGMYVSSSGAEQVFQVVDNVWSGGTTLASRDDAAPWVGIANMPGAEDGGQGFGKLRTPTAVALSWNYRGNFGGRETDRVYIADTANHTIRSVRFRASFEGCTQPYFLETLAGKAGEPGSADGDGMQARFHTPRGLAAAPDGSVYVADSGNHIIRRIGAPNGVTTVAGEAGVAGSDERHLNTPGAVVVNAAGEVFIADTGNHAIRKLLPGGRLQTVAGLPGAPGFADGPASEARFNGPVGLRFGNDGTLYVADTSNNVIRQIVPEPVAPRRRVRH